MRTRIKDQLKVAVGKSIDFKTALLELALVLDQINTTLEMAKAPARYSLLQNEKVPEILTILQTVSKGRAQPVLQITWLESQRLFNLYNCNSFTRDHDLLFETLVEQIYETLFTALDPESKADVLYQRDLQRNNPLKNWNPRCEGE